MNAAKAPPGLSMTCVVLLVTLSCLATSAQTAPPAGVAATAPNPNAVPIGISMSEAEYSWGSFPSGGDLAYIKSNNITLIRVPIAWERAQPTLFGALNSAYVSALRAFIAAAGSQGMTVIVDLHNYGRFNTNWIADLAAKGVATPNTGSAESIIGSTAVPTSALTDLWTKLAKSLKGTVGLGYYGIMNEPYGMGTAWPAIAQAAVTAIRLRGHEYSDPGSRHAMEQRVLVAWR